MAMEPATTRKLFNNQRGKIMKRLFLAIALFGLCGCPVICNLAKTTAKGIVDYVGPKWKCTHQDVMLADVLGWVKQTPICEKDKLPEGPIASIVCPILGTIIQPLLGTLPPASWGCDPSLVGADAVQFLVDACKMLPFTPEP
jgi:hypothetical protein